MLIIRRIMDKELQKRLCEMCGVEYDMRYYGYMAAEGNAEDGKMVIDSFIGILQFTMDSGGGYIHDLKNVSGVDDEEALFIMTRAVMDYLYTGEMPMVYMDEDACSAALMYDMGFRKNEHGEYFIDLDKFFEEPCKYGK